MFALVFIVGLMLITNMLQKEERETKEKNLKIKESKSSKISDSLLYYTIAATIVGARLGHCFFYEPAYYFAHPIEILYIRDGGLASHGGAIAVLIAVWLVARKYKLPFLYMIDRVVTVVALGGCFIRLGNLFNSEIYGTPTTLPWGFLFVRNGDILPCHPTQLYEALSYLLLFIGLYSYYIHKKRKPRNGIIFGIFLIVLFGMRFLIEFVKQPQENWEANYIINMGQILSLPFILAGIAILVYAMRKPKNIRK
jgi:prolipoprotein diacylglyceryl transferase